jgi:hypothetical protein
MKMTMFLVPGVNSRAPSQIQPALREDQKTTREVKKEDLGHEPFKWYFPQVLLAK